MNLRSLLFLSGIAMSVLSIQAHAQVACFSGASATTCGNPEFQACSITSGGAQRRFCLHEPDIPQTDVPVVFAFHGGGGDASSAVNWVSKHTEQGMILVAPSAQPSADNYPASGGTGCATAWRHLGARLSGVFNNMSELGDPPECGSGLNGDDLYFMLDLVSELQKQFNTGNFYTMGFSNGAGFVHQLKITEPFASGFSGFGVISAGVSAQKQAMVKRGAVQIPGTDFHVNGGANRVVRPVIQMFGTEEKINLPSAEIIQLVQSESVNVPSGVLTGPCYNPADWNALRFMSCLHSRPFQGFDLHDLPSTSESTREWLVQFNRAEHRSSESLYPDLGHGTGVSGEKTDDTMVVRRDHRATDSEDSAHVAALTAVGGGHAVPGATGNYAPCELTRSCDIDAVEEILQFWRAHAGLRNVWP